MDMTDLQATMNTVETLLSKIEKNNRHDDPHTLPADEKQSIMNTVEALLSRIEKHHYFNDIPKLPQRKTQPTLEQHQVSLPDREI